MKIFLFGSTGLLGSDLIKVFDDEYEMRATDINDINITNFKDVHRAITDYAPDLVINAAALTDVDKCETEQDVSYLVNAIGPKNIAIACRDNKVKMIHISTDYVFDGSKGTPYTEFDKPNPIDVYGMSKLAGEEFVQAILNDFIIIRTAWMFGEKRAHFVDYVVNGILKNDEVVAVKDMVSSPTYSFDLASGIKKLMTMNQTGIFHMVNKGYASRVEMIEEIFKIMKKQTTVKVMNQSQWKRPAKRPVFSALLNYHLHLMDCDEMPGWRDAIRRYIKYKFTRS